MRRSRMLGLVVGLAIAVGMLGALGCSGGDEPASGGGGSAAPAAKPSTPAPTPPPAPAPTPEPEPEAIDLSAGDAKAGAATYGINCATCHGPSGDGDGPLSASLDPKPARHSDGDYMNGLSDEHLVRVIRDGGAAVGKSALMAPWGGVLSDADIANVVAFLRSVAVPPYPGSSN